MTAFNLISFSLESTYIEPNQTILDCCNVSKDLCSSDLDNNLSLVREILMTTPIKKHDLHPTHF